MDNFKKYHDDYNERKSIGFFPGGFKPPHAGHFAALQSMLGLDVMNPDTNQPILLNGSESSDFVHVIIGHTPRGSQQQNQEYKTTKQRKSDQDQLNNISETMITKELSQKIWELYLTQGDQSISKYVNITISPHASPVIGMEQLILSLSSADIANSTLNLYAGQEDQDRYKYFTSDKFKMKISDQKNIDPKIISIQANMLDRLGSATDVRSQILRVAAAEVDVKTLESMIPPGVEPVDFISLLKSFR